MNKNEMTQQEYKGKLSEVAALAVKYTKTGMGYYTMREAFNDLAEKCGANQGNNEEANIGRRKILAQSVCFECIRQLDSRALDRLQGELDEVAEDIHPQRHFHR